MEMLLTLLPTLLQIVGWFVNRSNISTAQKKEFFDWVRRAGESLKSTKMFHYGESQIEELKNSEWKETP